MGDIKNNNNINNNNNNNLLVPRTLKNKYMVLYIYIEKMQ